MTLARRSILALRRPLSTAARTSQQLHHQACKALTSSSNVPPSSLHQQQDHDIPQRRSLSSSVTQSETAAAANRESFQELGFLDDRGLTLFDTLHEMQVRSCQVYAENQLFGTYSNESNQFEFMTFQDYGNAVDKCRSVLLDLGVQPYDKIGIISNNRWEWATIAAAAYSINANPVPMYEAQLPGDWTYILNDSGAKTLFVANQDLYAKVKRHVLPNTPLIANTLVLDTPGAEDEPYSFAGAMKRAQADTSGSRIVAPTTEDLANLIYTSGTTGKPKGVELTHLNFTSNIKAAARTTVQDPSDFVREEDVSLSFLPWAHSYGQTCELWMNMAHGASMAICRGIPLIVEDLSLVHPTFLVAVPTLYKKIYDGVHNMMESANPVRKYLMKSALAMGRRNVHAELGVEPPLSMTERWRYSALDRVVLSKIRARFGGNLRHGFVAGAACPAEVLDFMDDIGIPICEGYGLTETSPIIAINTPWRRQVGSVGRPIGGVEVFIINDETGQPVAEGEEGEICSVGPNVMKGYYKNNEATEEVISMAPDGSGRRMFHTGDLGRMTQDGFLKVTGRLKEQYKLENGKYVVPTPIEETIGLSRFIAQVVICGANRPYNVALLVPEWAPIRSELKVDEKVSDADLAKDPKVMELIDGELAAACKHLKKFEVPQEWAFVEPFTAANHMLTPKMSIRRHKVIQAYGDSISRMYGDDPVVAEAADSSGAKEHVAQDEQAKAA